MEDINYKALSTEAKKPHKDRLGDAGYDLYALDNVVVPSIPKVVATYILGLVSNLTGAFKKKSFETEPPTLIATKIRTGIGMEIPEGHFGMICDRSGMGSKLLKVLGGIIDSTYTGDITVALMNLSFSDYQVNKGDKVAQLIIIPYKNVNMNKVNELAETDRGSKGFGSSGR